MPANPAMRLSAEATLSDFADICLRRLREHFEVTAEHQMIALGSEVGEVADAYGRWAGFKRRCGTLGELGAELADVTITVYITAILLGADLDAALKDVQPVRGYPPGEQVLWLLKEAGAAAGEYLMWDALGRLSDRHLKSIVDRFANVVTGAISLADLLDIDLDAAWRNKAENILTRGWKEPPGADMEGRYVMGAVEETARTQPGNDQ